MSPGTGDILVVLEEVGYPREPGGRTTVSKPSFSSIALRGYSSLSSFQF